MVIDFGKASDDYAKYRDALPSVLFDQLSERGVAFEGERVVDLGSGTGIFSRDLARQGAEVTGIEPSGKLIEEAVKLDRSAGIRSISYLNSNAEDFVLSGKYPIFTAVRAWHWFDRSRVISNIRKHIEAHGYLIVMNSVFSTGSEIAKTTLDVARKHHIEIKPAGSHAEAAERRNGFPLHWFDEWEKSSFQVMDEWEFHYTLPFTSEEWCGKIRSVSWMIQAEAETKSRVTSALLKELSRYEPVLHIPHQYSVVVLKSV